MELADRLVEVGKQRKSLQQTLSMAVWTLLEPNVPMDSPLRKQKLPPMLDIKTTNVLGENFLDHVWARVIRVYSAVIEFKILITYETSIENKVVEIVEIAELSRPLPAHLRREFLNKYAGDADERFIRYLMNCCRRYYKGPSVYASAYVTVVQSSGFGKSRLLFEAATKISEKLFQNDSLDARLMYVCAGETENSTGFPVATPALSYFFFETTDIAERLLVALDYACEHWQSVQTDWLKLFEIDTVNSNAKTR